MFSFRNSPKKVIKIKKLKPLDKTNKLMYNKKEILAYDRENIV